MTTQLNKTVLASAALATAALGAAALLYRKFGHRHEHDQPGADDEAPANAETTEVEGLGNIEPGEISPKVDGPNDFGLRS